MAAKPQSIPILHSSYTPPRLRKGDRISCLVRDCMLIVSGWTDAPISWPCGCLRRKSPGSPSIIVDDELARAVRDESALAIGYWWGVSRFTVHKWRKALGADRKNNPGTQMLIRAATMTAREEASRNERTPDYRQKQREHLLRRRMWELSPRVTYGKEWTPEDRAMLGTMTDRDLASKTGRSYFAVKTMRQKLRIPYYRSETKA